jgi:hypothetical protein
MSRVTRPKRTPISGRRNVLTLKGGDTENFEYRIVNDTGDRIALFEAQGYEIVTDPDIVIGDRRISNPTKEGSPVKVSVGGGVQAYLMRQKKEYYKEDQSAKQAHVDETEGSIKSQAKRSADFGKLEISK